LPLNHFNSYLAGLFAQGGRFAVAMVSRDVTIIHPQALSDRALPSLASLAPLLMCRHVLCLAGAAAKRNGSGSMLPSRCSARQGGSLGSLGLQSISPQRRCRDERYGSDIVMFEGGIGDGPFLAGPRSIGSESETLLRPALLPMSSTPRRTLGSTKLLSNPAGNWESVVSTLSRAARLPSSRHLPILYTRCPFCCRHGHKQLPSPENINISFL
jgi:hypothetical protein